ncbi:MAG TPA: hypothetical protein VGC39_09915, partial [Candidatus Methylacidiphilales bacterium]
MLHLLPTLWFRNTWSWGRLAEETPMRPELRWHEGGSIEAEHATLGTFLLLLDPANQGDLRGLLFTENMTNQERLFGVPNMQSFVKDAFHEAVVHGRKEAVNPAAFGTKSAPHYDVEIAPGRSYCLRLRLVEQGQAPPKDQCFGDHFSSVLDQRRQEADIFYRNHIPYPPESEEFRVMRQAQAGMLWSKQFYNY